MRTIQASLATQGIPAIPAITAPQSGGLLPKAFEARTIKGVCDALAQQPRPPCLLRSPMGSGKTFILTKDAPRFKIVEDHSSLGEAVDFDDLTRLQRWMRDSVPFQRQFQVPNQPAAHTIVAQEAPKFIATISMKPQEISPGLVVQNLPATLRLSDYKLIAFDMDSTLINIECVDEIADAAGRKTEVAAITEAAMRGDISDYKDSLRQRVALLRGVTVAHMEEVYTQRLQLNPGATELMHACKAAGLKVLLVSGGFTYFTNRIRDRLDIDFARSNVLEIESDTQQNASVGSGGQLTGRLVDQPWGDICDGAEKRRTLLEVSTLMGITPAQCIAVGDGANDLPMMGVAGLSVAYHAKPKVREHAMVSIETGGLDRLLEVLVP